MRSDTVFALKGQRTLQVTWIRVIPTGAAGYGETRLDALRISLSQDQLLEAATILAEVTGCAVSDMPVK